MISIFLSQNHKRQDEKYRYVGINPPIPIRNMDKVQRADLKVTSNVPVMFKDTIRLLIESSVACEVTAYY